MMEISDFLSAIDENTVIYFWDTDFYGEPYLKGTFTSEEAYRKLFRNNLGATVTRIWINSDEKDTLSVSYQ